MTGVFTGVDDDSITAWERVHANGERTQVYVLPVDERFVSVAVDVDPVEFSTGAAAVIAYSPTETDATAHAKRWMEQHPRGVEGGSGGSGTLGKVLGGLQKLDQSANPANGDADVEDSK